MKKETTMDIISEGKRVIMKGMGPAKATRFWLSFYQGNEDYLTIKKSLFCRESVDSLVKRIKQFEK